jgi:asparagine synthase (glutamine-hydrolysing)
MCGFSGIVDFEKKSDLELNAKQAIDSILHRGPDNQGIFSEKDSGVYLGFNRLKIIDLNDISNQPFKSIDGSIIMMFNGEIYNYKSLREELKNEFEFKTESDTEVLLNCYQKYGLEFLEKIEGMFSICIFDKKANTVLLVRDRLGIKPLFYSINQKQIVFSSEIKSILKSGLVKKEINPTAISSYLTFLTPIDNQTPFLNILKLRPGELMKINLNDKTIAHNVYWDLKAEKNNDKEDEVIKKVLGKLEDSIAEQMQADVDFGCFLSGGLDSSLNAVLMSQKLGKPVKTLSVYFDNEKYSEIQYSRQVSELLKADKFERKIEQKDF